MNAAVKTLEKYRKQYTDYTKSGVVYHFDINQRKEIFELIRTEIDPKYIVDLFCGSCVCSMLSFAFEQMAIKYPTKNGKTA